MSRPRTFRWWESRMRQIHHALSVIQLFRSCGYIAGRALERRDIIPGERESAGSGQQGLDDIPEPLPLSRIHDRIRYETIGSTRRAGRGPPAVEMFRAGGAPGGGPVYEYPHRLSRQRQRVMISARRKPDLIADEPTTARHVTIRRRCRPYKGLKESMGWRSC